MPRDLAAEKRRLAEGAIAHVYGASLVVERTPLRVVIESALDAYAALVSKEKCAALETRLVEVGAILGYMLNAIDGEASDFALSFEPVRRVDDLRLKVAAQDEEIGRLRSEREWQSIETVPKRRKVLVGWTNELGNWRTTLATFYDVGDIELDEAPDNWIDEDSKNTVAGWWEDSQTRNEWYLDEKPTHWLSLPTEPIKEVSRG